MNARLVCENNITEVWLPTVWLPLTKQVEQSLVEEFVFGILWGHQYFLKLEPYIFIEEPYTIHIHCTLQINVYPLHFFILFFIFPPNAYKHVYLGSLWTGHRHQDEMQHIHLVNRSIHLAPVNDTISTIGYLQNLYMGKWIITELLRNG